MPTTVVFENALLADAVNKAARIAPTKGAAFDKAAGLQFQVEPMKRTCVIRTTDLEVSFEQEIPMVEGKGDPAMWRIPSSILQSLVSSLPMGEGQTVDFIHRDDEAIRFKSGRTMAKLFMIAGEALPEAIFEWTDGPLASAPDIAQKIEQVSWACDTRSQSMLSGVHIDGEWLVGCDTQVLAVIPSKVPVTDPVTVPLESLAVILKSASNCQIRAVNKRFQIALDEHTRVTSGLLEGNYPPVRNVMREDFIGTIRVRKPLFTETLSRMMTLAKLEKLPTLTIEINGGGLIKTLTFDMDIPGVGRMQDSIDIETEFADIFRMGIVPRKLEQAVEHAKGEYVDIDFGHVDPDRTSLVPIQIRDNYGYRCYCMPKKES